MRQYQICNRCVMDTTDSKITFNAQGICDHCQSYDQILAPNWDTGEKGRKELQKTIDKIKLDGKDREFDCIIGMSGGADSSYMLHVAVKEFKLRPLVFHVDGGWNSKISTNNIQVMVDKLGLDLYTEVINWEDMKSFQLAYLKSGLPNQDIPQDHAFVAVLYNFAEKYNIKYILNGGNFSTECINNPAEWIYYGTDMAQIKDVIRKFAPKPLKTYPFSSVFRHKIYLRYIRGLQVIKPLNFIPYIKDEAMKFLNQEYGWESYPQKHFESRFTRFYEGYWLPKRFGFDTRKVQFSSLILTGQMTREEALEKLSHPSLTPEQVREEFTFVATKLGITNEELESYLNMPLKFHWDYKNQESIFNAGAKILKLLGIERAIKR